jgi:hypothetical protein
VPSEDQRNRPLFLSETEVKNSGYPGALLMLGFLLEGAGIAICTSTIVRNGVTSSIIFILLFIVPGAILITKSVRARRAVRLTQSRDAGECPHCGYSRQGLVDTDKCPECGRAYP